MCAQSAPRSCVAGRGRKRGQCPDAPVYVRPYAAFFSGAFSVRTPALTMLRAV